MKKSVVPDAWDDDWEAQADKEEEDAQDRVTGQGGAALDPGSTKPLTKAERITQHEESNRRVWQSADAPKQTFHFLEANNNVPLTTNFKPQVKVLSRKPVLAKRDPVTGLSQLGLDDDDEPKQDAKDTQPTPAEIKAKQKRDLEERQRRYDEARAKIFGESASSSRGSSPGTGTVTPPRSDSRTGGQGRGRGGGGRSQRSNNSSSSNVPEPRQRQNNQPQARDRDLYDPNYLQKPDSAATRRADGLSSGRGTPLRDGTSTPPLQQQAIRSPRGPDGSGRGGFGFARRGANEG